MYYVSAAGSDANEGTSPETAWRTLNKVNSWRFGTDDTLRFRGGDVFSGAITNSSLSGAADGVVTINSYGDGRAIIDGGNDNGIHLVNPEFLTIENLVLKGSGWTGSGASAMPTNGGFGIWIENSRTAGDRLHGLTISHTKVSGFYVGVLIDTRQPNTTGFEDVTVTGNDFSDNLTMGFNFEGYNSNLGGPVDQCRNVYVGYNVIQRIPGDPYSGAGGIHGTFRTEAGGLQVTSTTGTIVEHNLVTDIAGFGGLKTGLTWGGSAALGVTNSRQFRISQNEVARTRCITRYDAAGIDADQDTQDGEIVGNLTYDNIGPGIQIGSYGGKVTGKILVHHNISYNDVRGNNAGGDESEQGAIRIWGNTDGLEIFNNTIVVAKAGTKGLPSVVNFEQVQIKSGDFGQNAHIDFFNNIFKTSGGVPIFWANRGINPTHLAVSRALGNVYDASGDPVVITTEFVGEGDFAKKKAVKSLARWRRAGFETLNGANYGWAGDAGLQNVRGFAPTAKGFSGSGMGIAAIDNFDLKPNSASDRAGVDPSLAGVNIEPGMVDFHQRPLRPSAKPDAGACPHITEKPTP